jgi:hypothetical protein
MMLNTKTDANFCVRKKRNNESGMILLIASTFIVLISIVVIGLINRNVSQVLSTSEHYKQIQAEQLARGAWWLYYEALRTGQPVPADYTVTNNNVTYNITFINGGIEGGTGRQIYRVNVTY